MNDQNQPNDELLPNQRYCPNLTRNEKCKRIVSYGTVQRCDTAKINNTSCCSCSRRFKSMTSSEYTDDCIRICPNPNFNIHCHVILKYANRNSCKYAARDQRVCKSCGQLNACQQKKKHHIEKLLLDVPESYYWIGFLLADGHLTNARFSVSLAEKDYNHLLKFADYIGYTKRISKRINPIDGWGAGCISYAVYLHDKFYLKQIKDKFDIHDQKTYNPPNPKVFQSMTDDQLTALVAGYIDGDGSISMYYNVKIQVHKSWLNVLKYFAQIIGESSQTYDRDFAYLLNCTTEELKRFKRKCLRLNLPLLNRKWDRVDLNFTSHLHRSKERYSKFIDLFKLDTPLQQIADCVGVQLRTIKKYKIRYENS